MASFFQALSTLSSPVAAQDRALHANFAQALADSALLEHSCKAALRLAQLWDPATSNCIVAAAAAAAAVPAAAAPATSGRGGCGSTSELVGGRSGRGEMAGASSGGAVVAQLQAEALQGCDPSKKFFTASAQPGALQPLEQPFLWHKMTSLLSTLEEVRAAQTPAPCGVGIGWGLARRSLRGVPCRLVQLRKWGLGTCQLGAAPRPARCLSCITCLPMSARAISAHVPCCAGAQEHAA